MKRAEFIATPHRLFGAPSLFPRSLFIDVRKGIQLRLQCGGPLQVRRHNFHGRNSLRANAFTNLGDRRIEQGCHMGLARVRSRGRRVKLLPKRKGDLPHDKSAKKAQYENG